MTKRYAILQKKLQELESEINDALSLPPQSPNAHRNLSQDIRLKLVFIANLLSAETASRPTKPHHLDHIARRLTQLDAAFRDWESPASAELLGHVDDASSCSCTESCLNDDGEADGDGDGDGDGDDDGLVLSGSEDSEKDFPGEEETEFYECVVDENEGKEERERKMNEERERVGVGKMCGAMAGGFLVGVASMGFVLIVVVAGCLETGEKDGSFLAPT